jgi:hypothetical protein
MERTKQQQTVAIDRGLFLVRYAAAEDEARPPMVKISPDPASNKDTTFLLHPDHNEALLWQPETCLVVRASAPGKLAVQVIPMQEGGSVAATVRIEPLGQGKAASAQEKGRSNVPHDSGDFRILGHVAGSGDVVVNASEWLAGPSAPSRIEGISLDWPGKPADLEVRYAVKTANPQPISGRTMGLGSFAGTRGKAMPIVSLMFELSGPGAADFQLSVEAIFLGAPTSRTIGKRVVASGPTGREPLVGLRLSLDSVHQPARPLAKASTSKPGKSAGRVRVFRGRSKSNQPATARAGYSTH